jgi:hypothetical protein
VFSSFLNERKEAPELEINFLTFFKIYFKNFKQKLQNSMEKFSANALWNGT